MPWIAQWKVVGNFPTDEVMGRGRQRGGFHKRLALATTGKACC